MEEHICLSSFIMYVLFVFSRDFYLNKTCLNMSSNMNSIDMKYEKNEPK